MKSEDSLMPPAILKSLQDKGYDKRKNASDEITKIVKECDRQNQSSQIMRVIEDLKVDTISQNSNVRKGALMGLTAVANGIDIKNIPMYLEPILAPVFNSLHDSAANIKFYSGDQLWKICILVRSHALPYFQKIFAAVVDLSMETDEPVRSQADRINNIMLDIVTETPELQLLEFIPCLVEKLNTLNGNTQAIVLRWLSILLVLPGVNLVPFIPALSEGVFNIMASATDENQEKAGAILHEFSALIEKNARSGNSFRYVDMINILVFYANSDHFPVQRIAFITMTKFIEFAKKAMLPYSPGILMVIMKCKGQESQDPDYKVSRQLAEEASAKLMSLIIDEEDVVYLQETESAPNESSQQDPGSPEKLEDKMYLSSVIKVFEMELKSTPVACKTSVLRWLHHLNEKVPAQMGNFVDRMFPCLLNVICDPADEIVILALQVLAQVASSNFPNKVGNEPPEKLNDKRQFVPGVYFKRSLQQLLLLFQSDLDKNPAKMSFIVRQLCVILPAEDNYRTLAQLLLLEENLNFAKAMVQSLSNILFTSTELFALRSKLIDSSTSESADLFVCLYWSWCHSPVATLTLCLLTKNYDYALQIVRVFAQLEVTTDTLVELDKLIQMLESPIFAFLRLDLMNPKENRPLVDTLLAILMLIPQTTSFHLLQKRLQCIPTAYLLKGPEDRVARISGIDFPKLLKHFNVTQRKHKQYKEQQVRSKLASSLNNSS